MELTAFYKRVIGLDVHQAQITACATIESPMVQRVSSSGKFGAFKRNRRTLAEWAASLAPDEVVMESADI